MKNARLTGIGLVSVALAAGAPAQVGYEWGKEFDSPHMSGGEVLDSVVFDDGTGPALFVSGRFKELHGEVCYSVIKFDGEAWTPLGGGLYDFNNPAEVTALEVYDADGAGPNLPVLVAAGSFLTANGKTTIVNNVAAWDGVTWSPMASGIAGSLAGQGSAEVWDLKAFDDGSGPRLYACGIFSVLGFRGMAVWDGNSWGPIGSTGASSGWGMALELHDDGSGPALYVGGNFGAIVGTPNTANLARWNGTSFSSLGPVFSDVQGLARFDPDGAGPLAERLVAAGRGNLEVWDGSTLTAVTGFNAPLSPAVATYDDGSGPAVYLGVNTTYSSTGARMHRWDGIASTLVPVGSPIAEYLGVAFAETLFVHAGELFCGGSFSGTAGAPTHGFLKWDGTDWVDPFPRKGLARFNPLAGNSGADEAVLRGVVAYDLGGGEELFAGGILTHAGSAQLSQDIGAWDGNSWRDPGPIPFSGSSSNTKPMGTWNDGTGEGLCVAVQQGPNSAIYRLDPSGWSVVGSATPHIPGLPVGMAVFDDGSGAALYIAARSSLHKWDGAAWTTVGSVPTNSINGVDVFPGGPGSALYIHGFFQSVNGVSAPNLARFDGSVWTAVAGAPTATVTSTTIMDDGSGLSLFVNGSFSSVASVPGTQGIARWDGSNWFSVGGGLTQGAWSMLGTHDDGPTQRLYGYATDPGLSSTGGFVRSWDGTQWQAVPNSFATNKIAGMLDFDDGYGSSTYFWGRFSGTGGTVVNVETTVDTANQSGGIVRWGVPSPEGVSYYCDGAAGNCPCGNAGAIGEGCANSTTSGSKILVLGSTSLAAADMFFTVSQLPPLKPAILFSGLNQLNGGAGNPFGDGLLCTSAGVQRHGVRFSDGFGDAMWGPGLAGAQPSAGVTRRFQTWYRDPQGGPCSTGFNTSNAASVTFTP